MKDLNYGLKKLTDQHKEDSYGTRSARARILQQAATALHELGYRHMQAHSLKPKHVEALVEHWKAGDISAGTMKNRLSHIRWWAEKIGKPAVVARSNDHYDIERRVYVTGEDKSRALEQEKLEKVRDQHVRMSLKLQEAFGLRREESIKFSPSYADKGDKIVLKPTWTKGGRGREVPVRTPRQREVLTEARRVAGFGSLIPSNKNYVQQLRVYERSTILAGLDKNHGLRHAYAQAQYREKTGWECPAKGGPKREALTPEQREIDQQVRQEVSRELGHERIAITAVYLG